MTAWLTIKFVTLAVVAMTVGAKAVSGAVKRSAARARMDSASKDIVDHALVTLEGVVRVRGEPIEAPLSGRPCVVYRARVRVYHRQGHGTYANHRVDREVERDGMVAFVLVSDRGEVVVEGDRAELAIRPSPVIPRSVDRERAFLGEVAVDPRALGSDEIVIEPGQRIRVHGIARVEAAVAGASAAPEVGYRDAPQVVRLVGDERHPLTITER